MSESVGVVLVVGAFVAFAAFLVWRHQHIRSENDDLLVSGTSATATVEHISPVLGEDDLFTVRLRIDADVIEVRWFLSSYVLPAVQPGRTVAVRLDAERRRAAFDGRAMGYG